MVFISAVISNDPSSHLIANAFLETIVFMMSSVRQASVGVLVISALRVILFMRSA